MRPLEGIRIVEMGTHIVVPVAVRVLSDWGAEVIKVEIPGGEKWRLAGKNAGLSECGFNLHSLRHYVEYWIMVSLS